MMIWFKIVMVFVGLMLVIVMFANPVPAWLYWLVLLLETVIVAVGIGIQFSAQCPRCGYNIGFDSRLALSSRCVRCQIRFR